MPGKRSFARCVEKVSRRGGVADPRAVCAASKMKAGEKLNRKKNPLDQAVKAYEDTHGHPPDKELVFVEEEHYHGFLPAWGQLISMVIVPNGSKKGIELRGFKGALLCFSEQYKKIPQLHIVGGDQSVDTSAFGIETNHEYETLGKCADIVYATLKTHLGPEGGDADYVHAFAEESAGKNKRVRIRLSPDVIYDRLNEKLKFSGGVYEITPEGIRD
jgi:hypothetical protein